MSKIVLYQEPVTGVTTNGEQYAFFINEDGLPTVKNGSQVVTFGTSGYALQGSSGSSGQNGTSGNSGSSGVSGTSGQDGATGEVGPGGSSGSSGESGSSGINGVDGGNGTAGSSGLSYGTSGSSGASGSSGSSGITGTAGSSGASLAKVYEDTMYSQNSSFIIVNTGQTRNAVAYFPQSEFGGLPLAFYQNAFDNPSQNTFTGVTANSAVTTPLQTFLNGKKLTSIKLNRIANNPSVPISGGTECFTTSANLLIYKGTIATSGSLSVSLVKTVDISELINFNVSGSTTTATIDLTADNIQTEHNEYIYVQINRTIDAVNSVTKFANAPGINVFFETVASGILGTNGTAGSSGSAGSSGLSFGTSGSSGSAGSSGLSFGTSGSSGASGAIGSSGSSGANGSSGTSAGGGGGITDLVNPYIKNAELDKTQTVAGSFSYLHGFFGNASHWGTDSNKNYEYGHTYPVVIPTGDTIDYVYFPINLDVANTNITFKIVVWDRKPGTYYPNNKLSEDTFTYSGATTGYKMLAYNLDYTNTGNTENHLFISLVGYDSTGTVYRFRQSVVQYNYDSAYGFIDLSNGDVANNYLHGVTIVFNSNWAAGVPSVYGPGSYGNIQFGTPFIPFFYNIVNN
jgi:hypothetical protein